MGRRRGARSGDPQGAKAGAGIFVSAFNICFGGLDLYRARMRYVYIYIYIYAFGALWLQNYMGSLDLRWLSGFLQLPYDMFNDELFLGS